VKVKVCSITAKYRFAAEFFSECVLSLSALHVDEFHCPMHQAQLFEDVL
jgi:hypothetical protein